MIQLAILCNSWTSINNCS